MPNGVLLVHVIRILEKHGFVLVWQKWSHAKFRREDKVTKTTIVPIHGKEIPYGTFRSIVRQSGIDMTEVLKMK